ncbi:MAG: serine hydrolase [Gemmatimonadota bacterium]
MLLQPSACARPALLFAVALLTALPLHAQDVEVPRTRTFPGVESPSFPYAQPEEVGLSSAKLDRLADEIAQWVAGGEIVGAELLIVKDRRVVLHESFGWSDREERRPMERNSLFSIKSMSKPFTAAAILMLVEDGKLSLDDPVSRYVPTFTNDSTTIHHLLTHTSGYAGLGDTEDFASLKEWVEDWATEVPTRPFGEYSYSDFNYAALGYVVEAVSGVPVETFIEEQILRPLGLDETYTEFSRDAPWADRMNSRYRWDEEAGTYEKYWSNKDDQSWQFYPAAWGLYSTAMDYAEFLAMWMDKGRYGGTRLLTEESVEEALWPHAQRPYSGYGYGWGVRKAPREEEMPPVFGHGGYDGTRAWAFPAVDAMVIFLTHSRGRAHRDALMNRLGMLEIFDHPGPYTRNLVWAGDQDVAEVDLSPIEQAGYVGTYREPGGDVVRVWQEGGRLHYRLGEPGERADRWLHLVPLGEHRFARGRYRGDQLETIDPLGRVQFVAEDGEATGLEILVEDQVQFSARRTQ